MTQTIPITVYTADCTGNASNCLYPNKIEIADEASAKLAFSKDLVCARYKNNYRNIDNFELSNALPGDCDNEHSDDPQDWVTAEDVADLFADVPHVIHYSRHHMKQKGNKGPRPRFHVVLLIQPEQDAERYTALKQRLQAAFPFFDTNALDAARFLFGTQDPQVLYHPGTVTLNDFLDEMDGEQSFADLEYSIPEGSRNSTMSRIGARIIKRYGDTAEAKDLFFQVAQQCSPPLEDRELESIWAGKQRLYSKIRNQPGYIPPDAYNSTGPVVWDTPILFDEYDLPTFPVDALPEVIRRYVLAVAESTQTYNSYGKAHCPSKAVPEEKLMQVAAQVGPVSEITAITARSGNLLEFTLKDGTKAVKRWQDRSRAESWTEEMRRVAGEKTRERKSF